MDASLYSDKLALSGPPDPAPLTRTKWPEQTGRDPLARAEPYQELQVNPDDTATTLTLGPFRVDAAGTLEAMASDPVPGFTCRWRDRLVHARLLPGNPSADHVPPGGRGEWRLHLQTPLARVPSSAGAPDAARRLSSFNLLRGLPATLPQGWRVGLAADHQVMLEVERYVPHPLTATSLVNEMTLFLLTLAPYLDVLEETGMTRPSEAAAPPAGMANT